ncbi:hypothetical protein HDU96_001251 [Phlyctochytrium bullatum]|nr:hypothetical protein HDU96_001251 [Phlyctochytrium bullatum]
MLWAATAKGKKLQGKLFHLSTNTIPTGALPPKLVTGGPPGTRKSFVLHTPYTPHTVATDGAAASPSTVSRRTLVRLLVLLTLALLSATYLLFPSYMTTSLWPSLSDGIKTVPTAWIGGKEGEPNVDEVVDQVVAAMEDVEDT